MNDNLRKKRNANHEESDQENMELINRKEKKIRTITVSTQKGATALNKNKQDINYKNSTKDQPEEIYLTLKTELEKQSIMIEAENNEEKTETKICSLKQILEIFAYNKILNQIEWIEMIRRYTENLIRTGYIDVKLKIEIKQVNSETLETSILRIDEEDNTSEEIRYTEDEELETSYESQDTQNDFEYKENTLHLLKK